MAFDILTHVISLPNTHPALCRAIAEFLQRERAFKEGRIDLTARIIRQLPIERMLLEERARASFRFVNR